MTALRFRSVIYALAAVEPSSRIAAFPEHSGLFGNFLRLQSNCLYFASILEGNSGSPSVLSRAHLELLGNQQRLTEATLPTGNAVILLVFSGRPLVLDWAASHAPAIIFVGKSAKLSSSGARTEHSQLCFWR